MTEGNGQLAAFFERIERMHEEKKSISDGIAEIFAEAKANGYDTKVMKIVLQKRRMDHAERMEQEALADLYMEALGMTGTPVATRAPAHEKREPALTHAADGADAQPVGTAEELQPGSSAPIQIEAPRGVEGEAEGASASPANFPRIPHMGTVRT
jgi:uncharacterized protein (UPF0335 family)